MAYVGTVKVLAGRLFSVFTPVPAARGVENLDRKDSDSRG